MKDILRAHRYKFPIIMIIALIGVSFLIKPVYATHYEIKGHVSWQGKPSRKVKLYLLREGYDIHKRKNSGGKEIDEISYQKFSDAYELLNKRQSEIDSTVNKKKITKARKLLIRDFNRTIKQHRIRRIRVYKDGGIYINVMPDVKYYLIGIRGNRFFEKKKKFRFWVEDIYFKPGDIEEPKRIIFDESSIIEW